MSKCEVLEEDSQVWPPAPSVHGQCPYNQILHQIHPLDRCHCQLPNKWIMSMLHSMLWRIAGMFHMDSSLATWSLASRWKTSTANHAWWWETHDGHRHYEHLHNRSMQVKYMVHSGSEFSNNQRKKAIIIEATYSMTFTGHNLESTSPTACAH